MTHRSRLLTLLVALTVGATTSVAALASPAAGHEPPASDPGTFAAERVLVKYEPWVDAATQAALERGQGASRVNRIEELGIHILKVPVGAEARVVAALSRNGRVQFAERDALTTVQNDVTPNDYWWPRQWSPVRVNAPRAWAATTGSPDVVVAVLDTGVSAVEDLAGKLRPGYDFVNKDSDPVDDHGHGTLAAGVIGAASNNSIGVASLCWACKVMPVKVSGADGRGTYSALSSGITYAADHGAQIISMSLSGTTDSASLRTAVKYARDKGLVLVGAAGNSGCDCKAFPAAFPEVIGVAASDSADAKASYSNYGSWVDVTAPGSNWTTTASGGFTSFSGTSSATPVVAGVVGLMRAAAPLASVSAVEAALRSGAVPVGYVADGRVDAAASVAAVAQSAPPPPAPEPGPEPAPSEPTLLTTEFSGSFSGKTTSRSHTHTVGAGDLVARVQPGKGSPTFTVTAHDASGQIVASRTAPAPFDLTGTARAGALTWTVSGASKTAYTLSVTAPRA